MGTPHHLTLPHPHPFFLLPTELHTEIFTCACTPSSSSASSPSYYESFYTSLALSRVSRYVRAAAAPSRLRAVVLEGWREMVGFLRVLESASGGEGGGGGERKGRGKVRYLTVIADEIPFDPIEMLAERVLYPPPPPPTTTSSTTSTSTITTTSTPDLLALPVPVAPQPQPHINATLDNRSRRKEKEVLREKMMLHTLGRILGLVGGDLYELELGMQAVVHFRDPLNGFGFGGGFGVGVGVGGGGGGGKGKGQGQGKQMCFPKLKSLFYACSPAGVYPWASTVSTAGASASAAAGVTEENRNERFPCLFCPVLNSLTVVISNEVLTPSFDEEGRDAEPLTTTNAPTDAGTPQPPPFESASQSEAGSESTTARKPNATPFPVLKTLTLLASTPTQALAALDVQDWEVGSEFGIVPAFEFPRTSTSGSHSAGVNGSAGGGGVGAGEAEGDDEQDLEAEDREEGENGEETSWVWPPRTLETVVMRPKARWGERWESLRDVVERDREVRERERLREREGRGEGKGKGKVVVKVLMPGEEL